MTNFPNEELRAWFLVNKRSLPWRENPTPYRVWISEIMLQQTQVAHVIPYFERWMALFPTITHLAEAPLERVMKCWEGLGYYSRVRNLLKGAQYIVTHYQGELPFSKEKLLKIPGIGLYTAGAISSFAFHQREAAVDGNVIRVLSRFQGLDAPIESSASKKWLQHYAESILPDNEPWMIVEALIELGALVCMKKANCMACPLKQQCYARCHSLQDVLPQKKTRVKTTLLVRHVAIIESEGQFLVQKREQGSLMADLYEFPYIAAEPAACTLTEQFERELGLSLSYESTLPEQKQSFTRYRVALTPHRFSTSSLDPRFIWKNKEELTHLPFSSGHKRILSSLYTGR